MTRSLGMASKKRWFSTKEGVGRKQALVIHDVEDKSCQVYIINYVKHLRVTELIVSVYVWQSLIFMFKWIKNAL